MLYGSQKRFDKNGDGKLTGGRVAAVVLAHVWR